MGTYQFQQAVKMLLCSEAAKAAGVTIDELEANRMTPQQQLAAHMKLTELARALR